MKLAALALAFICGGCRGYDYSVAVGYEQWKAEVHAKRSYYGKSPVPVDPQK